MRKSLPIFFAAALSAALVSTPDKAKASCWECWAAGAVVVGGVVAASSYAYGYQQGYYGAGYGYGPSYYAPPPPPTYGYYSPPYYDYGPAYYQRPAPRYVKRVRYVREEYLEPVYYEPRPVYYQPAPPPRPNYVRVRY